MLATATLLVYSPSLSQSPLFDESILLAWLSHCIKVGLTTSDTTAYLLAQAVDPRDGLTVLGPQVVSWIIALFTGTAYTVIRYLQILLHLSNALLLFAAVYAAFNYRAHKQDRSNGNQEERVQEQEQDREQDPDQGLKPGQDFRGRSFTAAAVAALFFCIFPLAPGSMVAWIFGLPTGVGYYCHA